jgi:hypothetical protein
MVMRIVALAKDLLVGGIVPSRVVQPVRGVKMLLSVNRYSHSGGGIG